MEGKSKVQKRKRRPVVPPLLVISFLWTIQALQSANEDSGCPHVRYECVDSVVYLFRLPWELKHLPKKPASEIFFVAVHNESTATLSARDIHKRCIHISRVCYFEFEICGLTIITGALEPLNVPHAISIVVHNLRYRYWQLYRSRNLNYELVVSAFTNIQSLGCGSKHCTNGALAFQRLWGSSRRTGTGSASNEFDWDELNNWVEAAKFGINTNERMFASEVHPRLTLIRQLTIEPNGFGRFPFRESQWWCLSFCYSILLLFYVYGAAVLLVWAHTELRTLHHAISECKHLIVRRILSITFVLTGTDRNLLLGSLCLCWKKSSKMKNSYGETSKNTGSPHFLGWTSMVCATICMFAQSSFACTDIGREDLSDYPCLEYDNVSFVFNVTCSLKWISQEKCIVLQKNERFEGNGQHIDLSKFTNWEGLFEIASTNEGGPSSLQDAPIINDVHMMGGNTSITGGFIVRSNQKHVIVNGSSSSGVIEGRCGSSGNLGRGGGGGICGRRCSGDVLITHCWSSGEIRGCHAGGIAGRQLGWGHDSGGGGQEDNVVTISHCYSTGDIVGRWSGGICGRAAGRLNNGRVTIQQCYSLGQIRGEESGGITGSHTANKGNGNVSITNCYSRGNITGSDNAGGICGRRTGVNGGTVILTNVYASGTIIHETAGGILGEIADDCEQVSISMSVYDGSSGDMIGAESGGSTNVDMVKNSCDLKNITGTVYCYYRDTEEKECWDTETIWKAVENDFPILLPQLSSTPSPSATTSTSLTRKQTHPLTPTSTSTGSNTATMTPSDTPSKTSTATISTSQTGSVSPSFTSSETPSSSENMSPTPTGTETSRVTCTETSTVSGTHTQSVSVTPSECCQHSGESGLQATMERTDVLFGLCLTTMLSLLIMYIGYKRVRNKRNLAAKSHFSYAAMYAIKLGISENHNQRQPSEKNVHEHDGEGAMRSPPSPESVAQNPFVRIQSLQQGSSHHGGSTVAENMISNPNSMTDARSLPFTFVDIKSMEPSSLSKVKVLSTKQPDLRGIAKGDSVSNAEPKMQIARISDLDTSEMNAIDRTVMKLRKWKAIILAEPPPVVAVSLPGGSSNEKLGNRPSSDCHGNNTSKQLASQLEFAAMRRESDRSVINTEIRRYTQSRRQGFLRKKEFTAVPPSLQETHEAKV